MALRLRDLTREEQATLERLAHSRAAPARQVERARMLCYAHQGLRAGAIAETLQLNAYTVRSWIKRFSVEGLAGLEDWPRPGRPATYRPEEVAEVIAAALSDPKTLDLPFACWTLDRLQAYLNEHKGIGIKRSSRIDEILRAEGLRWRKHESWWRCPAEPCTGLHGERIDPAFAEKRGSWSGSTPRHLRGV